MVVDVVDYWWYGCIGGGVDVCGCSDGVVDVDVWCCCFCVDWCGCWCGGNVVVCFVGDMDCV